PRPDLVGATPDVVHVFQHGEAKENEIAVFLFVEKMGGAIGRHRMKASNMPSTFKGEIFETTWKGFALDVVEVPEDVNGVKCITYNVQIPLKREAIQLKLFASADKKALLDRLLRQVLDGLDGDSNWLSTSVPKQLSESESFKNILVAV